MSNRCQVTVLYSENKLQRTISLDPALASTVADAKKSGSEIFLDHFRDQPGIPPSISIDDDCTDFYPAAPDTARMRDLKGPITMTVWPKATPGSKGLTPSPVMDALSSTTTELADARSRLSADALIKETKQSKKSQKSKSGSSNAADPVDSMLTEILSRLTSLEKNNAELKEGNTELRETNADLQGRLTELEAMHQTTMEAVLGDRIAINKIRNRVLLDLGRDKLAEICGYTDWKHWKTNSDRDRLYNFALTRLKSNLPLEWMALGSRPTALGMLLLPSQVRSRGNIAAHSSARKLIGESVLALTVEQERNDMIVIYRAVYGVEPDFDTRSNVAV